jgi:cytochrome b subunit of formate dehydrogenase
MSLRATTASLAWAPVCALLATSAATAQGNDDCLMCHADPDLTGTRQGRVVSLFVDGGRLDESIHAGFDCILCHQDLDGAELPHEEDVAPVECGICHEDVVDEHQAGVHGEGGPGGAARRVACATCHGSHDIGAPGAEITDCGTCHREQGGDHDRSLHGQAADRGDPLAPSCVDCHGQHDVRSNTDADSPTSVMNVPFLCGRCHQEGSEVSETRDIPQDQILRNYSMSIHGQGLYERGLTVTAVCTSCHTSHKILPHTDPESSIHHEMVASTCADCHGQIEAVHRKFIEGRLWEEEPHKIPACVDCHSPHKIRRVFYPAGMASQDCLRCHGDAGLTMERDGETVSLYVDEAAHAGSSHSGTSCAQCHTGVSPSRERSCETITAPVDCSICHAQQVNEYRGSTHGTLFAAGDPDAPGCLDCHDNHATQDKSRPTSPTFARNVPSLCAKCHRQGEKAAVRIETEIPDIVNSYIDSIHGKGLVQSGLIVTATCADCHSAHSELPPGDPSSTVHRDNIAGTCGSCHHGIEETFKTSIHWPEIAQTEQELPTCEDCHSSHTISRVDLDDFRMRMMDQCGRCHVPEAETFFDTFHGKVSRLGSAGAAKCYDCHGTHNILPTTEPASALSRSNVVETCGQCHPGSHRRFAGYLTHATHHDQDKYPWLFYSFWFMTALLVGTLTFALLHTFAWLIRLWLNREEWREHKALVRADHKRLYKRFTAFQRLLHFLMLISFFVLALTGMCLKFSYMPWAQWLAWLMGGFETTGVLHRMGGVTLFIVFGLHLWDVFHRKRKTGQSLIQLIVGPDSILFNHRDVKEIFQSIKWFFGRGPRPHYGRYTYWEKFDYFAVFWGIGVIGSTGLLLWFPELFTYILPGWAVNVATIIHSDEALLAVGFIFTIHFFNTHFRPDKFPMDPVIFTGRVTVDELQYDKPAEYEALAASGELEQYITDPYPQPVERGFKAFGFFALTIGLALIALIVYSMLFGYR